MNPGEAVVIALDRPGGEDGTVRLNTSSSSRLIAAFEDIEGFAFGDTLFT